MPHFFDYYILIAFDNYFLGDPGFFFPSVTVRVTVYVPSDGYV